MTRKEELILKATKEIMVKFIETGRVSPTSFEENYKLVSQVIRSQVIDLGAGEAQ